MTKLTVDTITNRHIRDLRMAAHKAEDAEIVSVCTMALWEPLSNSDRMFLLEPYRSQAFKAEEMRKEARARCAEILNGLVKKEGT
jgi:superfamily I DNA and/or RNA helicase